MSPRYLLFYMCFGCASAPAFAKHRSGGRFLGSPRMGAACISINVFSMNTRMLLLKAPVTPTAIRARACHCSTLSSFVHLCLRPQRRYMPASDVLAMRDARACHKLQSITRDFMSLLLTSYRPQISLSCAFPSIPINIDCDFIQNYKTWLGSAEGSRGILRRGPRKVSFGLGSKDICKN